MKKFLFTAVLVAGTTLGFAKDNVQKNEVKTTTTKEVEQSAKIPQAGSNVEAESIKATCTDVTIATTKVKGETVVISSCETSYPCVSGGTSVYVINV